jgi:NTP pyrophosphatase (non-canonical NTP hydrolase)
MTETIPIYHTAKGFSNRVKVLNDIPKERHRQDAIHAPTDDVNMMFIILLEEVGEVAQALQALHRLSSVKSSDKTDVYKELIQVAAVATKMAEKVLNDED